MSVRYKNIYIYLLYEETPRTETQGTARRQRVHEEVE